MGIEDDIALFERVPTFALLGREALRILAIGAENRYVHSGQVLFQRGESAEGGYVVQEGTFALSRDGDDEGEPTVVGPGTLLGETALLTETLRPVTATAREPATVIRIARSLFVKMLEGYPEAAARLRADFAARAEQATREVTSIRDMLDAVKGRA
jgi:CRP-like cAMP-binding protein